VGRSRPVFGCHTALTLAPITCDSDACSGLPFVVSLRSQLAWYLRSNPVLRGAVYQPLHWIHDRTLNREAARRFAVLWEQRHRDVTGCADNAHIPRVPDAGRVDAGVQTMHNGVKIRVGSYYGDEVTRMLERNRGVHEPQEERVFAEVLRHLPPRPTMMELGAYWGFYSLWFLKDRPLGRAILVEPESENLRMGRDNFAINGAQGEFVQAFVGAEPSRGALGPRTVSVDELVEEFKVQRLHFLHVDIQGHELHMLDGARRTFERGLVDYIFISTHTPELHEACRRRLGDHGFVILADADIEDTYSLDGLLAARHERLDAPAPIDIALKRRDGLAMASAAGRL
jgi:Methyltransferase FkbM domain